MSVTEPNIKRRQGVTSHCPISQNPARFNSAHRVLQVEGCASKSLKKVRTLLLHRSRLCYQRESGKYAHAWWRAEWRGKMNASLSTGAFSLSQSSLFRR